VAANPIAITATTPSEKAAIRGKVLCIDGQNESDPGIIGVFSKQWEKS
jgi:hypothetical protein